MSRKDCGSSSRAFFKSKSDSSQLKVLPSLLAAVIGWGRERGAVRLTGEFKPDLFSKPQDIERFYTKWGISVTADGNLEGKL